MNLEEYKGVFVFAQQVDNEISNIAFELLGKAKDLASDLNTDVTAVFKSLAKSFAFPSNSNAILLISLSTC